MRHTAYLLYLVALGMGLYASPLRAQEPLGMEGILQQIATHNKELMANERMVAAQKLENRTENNLPDPTLSYAHVWDSHDKQVTAGELVVAQSFDFPTLYATRTRLNRHRASVLDAEAEATRQRILLQAKELCIDIIGLYRQHQLLARRRQDAETLSALYAKRLEAGDANVLETNKINLELLNVRTEARLNATALQGKLKELLALNGNQPLAPGRPTPFGPATPNPEQLGLTDYPEAPLPERFDALREELLEADPALRTLRSQKEAAGQQLRVNRQGWLPKLELGYRRNTESGHPLNGVVVGFSFPLFENRSKVKIAKAQSHSIDFRHDEARIREASRLHTLFEEAHSLQEAIREYRETLGSQQDLALLRQALLGGQINMTEYFVEAAFVYQTEANLTELENQYHRTVARLYRSRL